MVNHLRVVLYFLQFTHVEIRSESTDRHREDPPFVAINRCNEEQRCFSPLGLYAWCVWERVYSMIL